MAIRQGRRHHPNLPNRMATSLDLPPRRLTALRRLSPHSQCITSVLTAERN
jgi:hypothetical protein